MPQTECDKAGCAEVATHLATNHDTFAGGASHSFQFCTWHTAGARHVEAKYHLGTTFVPLNGAAPQGRAAEVLAEELEAVCVC